MFPYNVRNTNANLGFSLMEMMVVLALVGAIAAIGIPGFAKMRERFEANSAFDQVQGAIKNAQLQAIRLSKSCTININTTDNTINVNDRTADKGCLLATITLPSSTNITTNSNTNTVSFTFQGNTNLPQTIIVSNTNKNHNKCLVISAGIGIMRAGDYDYITNTCTTQQ